MINSRFECGKIRVPIRVLLAEDNEDDIIIARDVFQRTNLQVQLDVVRDGAEALSLLNQVLNTPGAPLLDLIFLDINMPKKSGFDVLEALQKDDRLKRVPAVMLSGSSRFEDITRSQNSGAATYLIKPLTLVTFQEIVDEYLFPESDSANSNPGGET